MSSAQVDPHDKMRSRDVNRVARGEQAPRPDHEFGTVSKAPPPSAVQPKPKVHPFIIASSTLPHPYAVQPKPKEKEDSTSGTQFSDRKHHCSIRYYEYHRCIHEKRKGATDCDKFQKAFRELCQQEWIEKLDKEREEGSFPLPI